MDLQNNRLVFNRRRNRTLHPLFKVKRIGCEKCAYKGRVPGETVRLTEFSHRAVSWVRCPSEGCKGGWRDESEILRRSDS